MNATVAPALGTATGWALTTSAGRVIIGAHLFKLGWFEGGGVRYLQFRRRLTELKAATEGLEAIYFVGVRRHAGVDAAHAYGGFLAPLTAWCEQPQHSVLWCAGLATAHRTTTRAMRCSS